MGAAQRRIRKSDGTKITASKRFGRYKREDRKVVKEYADERCEVLDVFIKALRAVSIGDIINEGNAEERYYGMVSNLSILKGLDYSALDVERLTIVLPELVNKILDESSCSEREFELANRVGLFMSALINNGKDDKYVLRLEYLPLKLHYLGYQNRKKALVKGDGGENCGFDMEGGRLMIEGNVYDGVGSWMKGGVIIVNGDAGMFVGREMLDGEIHLNGRYRSVGNEYGELLPGKVYHKGVLLEEE
jgi:hypothetical protein